MRMILIYALVKRDQISGSGRVSGCFFGAFLVYNIGILNGGSRHAIITKNFIDRIRRDGDHFANSGHHFSLLFESLFNII
jgi:hypothetical protein